MNCKEIKQVIEDALDIKLSEDLREIDFINARVIYFYFCKRWGDDCYSDTKLAKTVGLTRVSVYHSLKKFHDLYKFDKSLQRIYNIIDPLIIKDERYVEIESYELFDLQIKYIQKTEKLRSIRNKIGVLSKELGKKRKMIRT